ncbi:MAG: SH3 domain-containing protein [Cyanobacteria bacterium P01_A01_bin.37]
MGKFELKICEQKDEKKPDPPKHMGLKIVVTIAATLGVTFQVSGNTSSENTSREADSPSIASSDAELPEHSPIVPPSVSPDILVTPDVLTPDASTLRYLSLTTIEAVETLPATIKQAIDTQNFEAIALLFTDGEYWLGNVKSTLDMQTVAATDTLLLQQMEGAIAAGCRSHESDENETIYWVCPGTTVPVRTDTLAASATVLIDGDAVNIRTQPTVDSEVLTAASYQVVSVAQDSLAAFSEDEQFALNIGSGWCPVIVDSGQLGYVASQFCRPIQQSHTLLRLVDGQWQVTIATP